MKETKGKAKKAPPTKQNASQPSQKSPTSGSPANK